eukprot:CAMPEP_0177207178 /NCGR_PEP_ID=MMETSP0367-20130122/29779_1 /TAXON_ID=447022 ORGANISM="Scrippsiella hangoei-like, Strain SHHI-4" /NCGR_SAMPLE_ID=MMETSP0367 /ASSEMBLY_ACC=CAM_ASM_000362 /LENGTH=815 /DNA_ID=CAMNT_0018655997 /DNA_START=73 /DNA_END=2517 /DNA_ORIENTATION=+
MQQPPPPEEPPPQRPDPLALPGTEDPPNDDEWDSELLSPGSRAAGSTMVRRRFTPLGNTFLNFEEDVEERPTNVVEEPWRHTVGTFGQSGGRLSLGGAAPVVEPPNLRFPVERGRAGAASPQGDVFGSMAGTAAFDGSHRQSWTEEGRPSMVMASKGDDLFGEDDSEDDGGGAPYSAVDVIANLERTTMDVVQEGIRDSDLMRYTRNSFDHPLEHFKAFGGAGALGSFSSKDLVPVARTGGDASGLHSLRESLVRTSYQQETGDVQAVRDPLDAGLRSHGGSFGQNKDSHEPGVDMWDSELLCENPTDEPRRLPSRPSVRAAGAQPHTGALEHDVEGARPNNRSNLASLAEASVSDDTETTSDIVGTGGVGGRVSFSRENLLGTSGRASFSKERDGHTRVSFARQADIDEGDEDASSVTNISMDARQSRPTYAEIMPRESARLSQRYSWQTFCSMEELGADQLDSWGRERPRPRDLRRWGEDSTSLGGADGSGSTAPAAAASEAASAEVSPPATASTSSAGPPPSRAPPPPPSHTHPEASLTGIGPAFVGLGQGFVSGVGGLGTSVAWGQAGQQGPVRLEPSRFLGHQPSLLEDVGAALGVSSAFGSGPGNLSSLSSSGVGAGLGHPLFGAATGPALFTPASAGVGGQQGLSSPQAPPQSCSGGIGGGLGGQQGPLSAFSKPGGPSSHFAPEQQPDSLPSPVGRGSLGISAGDSFGGCIGCGGGGGCGGNFFGLRSAEYDMTVMPVSNNVFHQESPPPETTFGPPPDWTPTVPDVSSPAYAPPMSSQQSAWGSQTMQQPMPHQHQQQQQQQQQQQ